MSECISQNEGLISIIMPVFNAGIFLRRSIDSVKKQTYKNWELLIVDDGSTDDSISIIQSFSKSDNRIKVLTSSHGGAAHARNIALNEAKGIYIAFLDADDVYHPQFLELLLYGLLKNGAEISACEIEIGLDVSSDFYREYNISTLEWDNYSNHESLSLLYSGVFGKWNLMISPWNKLYLSGLFDTVRFPDGQFFEDASTINILLYMSKKTQLAHAPLYFYYVTPGSSSKTNKSIELLDREKALRNNWEFLISKGEKELALKALRFYLLDMPIIYYRILESDNPDDSSIIKNHFNKVYDKYARHIDLSADDKEKLYAFRYPRFYDVRNMINIDGIVNTTVNLIKRKLNRK